MRKVIVIPDSFKGTMTSPEVCDVMAKAIRRHYPNASIVTIPVADGGEGSVDCFLSALGGKRIEVTVKGPHFNDVSCYYGILPDGTAVIEMAACAGLPLAGSAKDPTITTTYGVGELIAHAINQGSKKIVLGLGGSATNDGGAGAATALGIKFTDKNGRGFTPTGGTLKNIRRIDCTGVISTLKDVEIISMCDIDNPLYGENGAAYVFSPQKGADADTVSLLDDGLRHFAKIIKRDLGIDVSGKPGAGAAGGMGAGMVAFFASELKLGIEVVLDTIAFDTLLENADLVISGEGKIDTQTLRGKVIIGIAKRAKIAGVPLIAVVGDIDDGIESVYEMGVSGIFSINRMAIPYEEVKHRAKSDLSLTMENIMRLISLPINCGL